MTIFEGKGQRLQALAADILFRSTVSRSLIALALLASCTVAVVLLSEPSLNVEKANDLVAIATANFAPVVLLWLALAIVMNRILAAASLVALFISLIAVSSSLKYSVLGEPMIASDFLLAGQLFGSFTLFLPYIDAVTIIGLVLLCALLVAIGWLAWHERPVFRRRLQLVRSAFVVMLVGYLGIGSPIRDAQAVYDTFDLKLVPWHATSTVRNTGLVAELVLFSRYLGAEIVALDTSAEVIPNRIQEPAPATHLPDIVVVQSEAFFDLRTVDPGIPFDYSDWDALKEHTIDGTTHVETYGGATLRTEFSFLAYTPLDALARGAEYPYFSVTTHPVATLASDLASLGYRTVAIHPYPSVFWNRNVAYPNMGFQETQFIDTFKGAEHFGPYVEDQALMTRLRELVGTRTENVPLFVFIVTMENHGPWHFNRKLGIERSALKAEYLPKAAFELAQYLAHLENGIRFARELQQLNEVSGRPTMTLFFGDHAPALPSYYKTLGIDNPWTSAPLRNVPFALSLDGRVPASLEGLDGRQWHIAYLASLVMRAARLPMSEFHKAILETGVACTEVSVVQCKEIPAKRRANLLATLRARIFPD